jgi:diguanylate cyclase (GGDEF)-like protein
MQCPIPENETQRLQAVRSYDILDTPAEVDFDALTRVAAHAFKTPAAVVGLMDSDRLWFKSRFGLDVPQLDRQIAFCAYALMRPDEALVIEDLQQDSRFRDNPLVTQAPHLRFYAGAPLIDPNGYALGTIAVVDVQPRTMNEEQRSALRDLATLVITALESRRRAIQLGRLALTDHLTGLSNRAHFERTLRAEMTHAQRTGEPFTLLYMDLDGFKAVNDTLGHAAGDEVLVEIARRLEKQVRAGDLLARLGGDEFGVFMREATQDSAESLASRIAEAVLEPITLSDGNQVNVGISVGMSASSEAFNSYSSLLTRADQALYQEKRKKQSPNPIPLYSES